MHTNNTTELCPFCLEPRDEKATPVLTMNRTYVICGHCGQGAGPKFWHPSYLVRIKPVVTETVQ